MTHRDIGNFTASLRDAATAMQKYRHQSVAAPAFDAAGLWGSWRKSMRRHDRFKEILKNRLRAAGERHYGQ